MLPVTHQYGVITNGTFILDYVRIIFRAFNDSMGLFSSGREVNGAA